MFKKTLVKDFCWKSLYDESMVHGPTELRQMYGVEKGSSFYVDGSHMGDVIEGLYYRLNSQDYLGQDIDPQSKNLAIGCSVSAGIGLYYKWTWPYMLSELLGESVNNVSAPGGSMSVILDELLKYLNKYSAPKNLYILAPDMYREYFLQVTNKKLNKWQISWESSIQEYVRRGPNGESIPLEIVDMYNKKRTLPVEHGVASFARSLARIVSLCNILDINLKISSWDPISFYFLKSNVRDKMCDRLYGYDYEDYILNPGEIDRDRKNGLSIEDLTQMGFVSGYKLEPYLKFNQYLNEMFDDSTLISGAIEVALDRKHFGVSFHLMYLEQFINRRLEKYELESIIHQPTYDKNILTIKH